MTTYSITGFAIDINTNTDTDTGVIPDVEFELIAPDNSGFTYSILNDPGDDLPEVQMEDDLFGVTVDGENPNAWESTDFLGEVTWSGGTAVVFVIERETGPDTARQYIIQIGGDPLPDINNLDDLAAFDDAMTGASAADGAFGPGETILWEDIPGGTSTENDRIVGRNRHDDIDAGKGNDVVLGKGGNDTLDGGAGRDTLNGGDGNDDLAGDGKNDKLIGGKGQDTLNGDAGNDLLIGGRHDDTFVFRGKFGDDTIRDFNATDNGEKVDLSGVRWIKGMKDLRNNHMSQDGDDVVIDDAHGNTIRLEDVQMSDLGAGDFIF